jgi:hypothetical protein
VSPPSFSPEEQEIASAIASTMLAAKRKRLFFIINLLLVLQATHGK